MATVERRQRGPNAPVRYRVRWRTASGAERSRTFTRHDEAARYRAQLEGDLISALWIDPMLARVPLGDWAAQWRSTIVDLRPTSLGRLDSTLANHVLPHWGDTPLSAITNADVRAWVAQMSAAGMSASSVRKAAFTLRQILAAAVADRRLTTNAAEHLALPVEEPGEQRFLTAEEVARLAALIAPRFRVMVLVAAYGGLRFGELTALRRARVDPVRGRLRVAENLCRSARSCPSARPRPATAVAQCRCHAG